MVAVGLILLLIGLLVGPPILTTLGIVLLVVGLLLNFGNRGAGFGGRRYY